jgi:hypothetical protein
MGAMGTVHWSAAKGGVAAAPLTLPTAPPGAAQDVYSMASGQQPISTLQLQQYYAATGAQVSSMFINLQNSIQQNLSVIMIHQTCQQ